MRVSHSHEGSQGLTKTATLLFAKPFVTDLNLFSDPTIFLTSNQLLDKNSKYKCANKRQLLFYNLLSLI